MTIPEAQNLYRELISIFNSQDDLVDISSSLPISIGRAQADSDLNRFFGLDEDGPYSEFLGRGLKSLRMGFYKICAQPFYNTLLIPGTFASEVLYLHPDNDKLIKYNCNIGPMTNARKIYNPIIGSANDIDQIPMLERFEQEKLSIGNPRDHYMVPKRNFFNSVFTEGKLFFITESIWDPNYPNENPRSKRVIWSFIN